MVGEEDKGVCGVRCCDCEFRRQCDEREQVLTAFVKCYKRDALLANKTRSAAPVTNADHIRAMSDEELAKFLCKLIPPEACSLRCPANAQCYHEHTGLAYWLQQPYEEDEA